MGLAVPSPQEAPGRASGGAEYRRRDAVPPSPGAALLSQCLVPDWAGLEGTGSSMPAEPSALHPSSLPLSPRGEGSTKDRIDPSLHPVRAQKLLRSKSSFTENENL